MRPDAIHHPAWDTAVPDWAERIKDGRGLVPDLPLFDAVAERALRIFKRLRVPDLIGTPTYGEVCEPWVFDLVRAVFGSYDPEAKRRMIQEFFLLVPKKNGKSAIAAAIIVTAAILNERPAAELWLIAPTHQIANIAFKQARGIIALDDDLATLFHVQVHLKKITHRATEAEIMILSADGDVITGSKATFVLIDETHVLGSKSKAADIFLELRGGLAARPDGFLLQITTQSKSPPSGQFKKELEQARAVRDGVMSLPVLAILYELPPAMLKAGDWKREETWGLVNPNLERSVSLDFLRREFAKAEVAGSDALALFASQHLNVEVGVGLNADRWLGAEFWGGAGDPAFADLERILEASEVCTIGIDGGGLDDLGGLAVFGRERRTRIWRGWFHAWAHPVLFERRKDIEPRLLDFAEANTLTRCETPTQDIEEIVGICGQVRDAGLLPAENGIGIDPNGVGALVDALAAAEMEHPLVVAVMQGWKLTGAVWTLERKLNDGTFRHDGSALMAWCVGNAKAEQRGNARVVNKQSAGSGKIDPLVAGFNAATLMALNPEASGAGATVIGADYRMAL